MSEGRSTLICKSSPRYKCMLVVSLCMAMKLKLHGLVKVHAFSLLTFCIQDGNVVHFKAKITTPFRKLMTAYCDRQSVASESVVFLFEGERLRGEQTPQEVSICLANNVSCAK